MPFLLIILFSCSADSFARADTEVLKLKMQEPTETEEVQDMRENIRQSGVDIDILLERLEEVHPVEYREDQNNRKAKEKGRMHGH